MEIIVIEPHPDDAFLSLGWHLEKIWKGIPRTIVTVYANEKRSKEAAEYADQIGAMSIDLGLDESKMDSSIKTLKPAADLVKCLRGLDREEIRFVFPIGFQHPDHKRVAAARGVIREGQVWRYLDTPYQAKLKLADELSSKVAGMRIESICFPPKNKWRRSEIYKSQSKFFYYNAGLFEAKLPEMVLSHA